MLWCSVALLALFASVQGRAVNISNTWVLPEEGFPVFYRYFRDRISWYEADAVCQFHHANLVTVDTTAQYDAVRAYLKELDISSAVWVGLIRSNPDGDFTWTDYRGLSGEGYWSSAPDARAAPLCAAADPAADYRWEARACGGPTVASFICELPVPQWALGNEGCMVRALPALTILYLPESAAVQLTADCGLAGVKRVQCTGNVKRDDLLRELSCSEEEELTTTAITPSGSSWPVTTDSVYTDQDTTTEGTTEDNATTEHEDDINQSSTILPSSTAHNPNLAKYKIPTKSIINANKFNRINYNLDKNLDLASAHSNNLQSNYIPKIANGDNYLSNEQLDKIEDEKNMQHKMLHEEIARLGNLENIFTQPTDHFVPPLVMAKAKISDDMTVLSLQEKHAQQLAEQHLAKQNSQYSQTEHNYSNSVKSTTTTEEPKTVTINKIIFMQTMKSKDNNKKDKSKASMPKKYNEKTYDPKSKIQKAVEMKPIVFEKITEPTTIQTEAVTKHTDTTSIPLVGRLDDDEDASLDLTVLLKDNSDVHEDKLFYNYSGDVSRLEIVKNSTSSNDTEVKFYDIEATEESKQEISSKDYEEKIQNMTSNHEVINITIISEEHTTVAPTTLEITTRHVIQDNTSKQPVTLITEKPIDDVSFSTVTTESLPVTTSSFTTASTTSSPIDSDALNIKNGTETVVFELTSTQLPITTTTTEVPIITTTLDSKNISIQDIFAKETTVTNHNVNHEVSVDNYNMESHEDFDVHSNTSDTLDDFNSPLLSGANEPLRRPARSRRPQQPPNRNKFNPFRILG